MDDVYGTAAQRCYQQRAPMLLKIRSSKWTIGITAFVATFTDGFVYGAIVPVLPFLLVERSGVSEQDVQFWITLLLAVYGSFVAIGAPFAAWVAKRGSLSTTFLSGLAMALAASAVFCLTRNPDVLVLGRALQGFSGSIVYAAGLALVADAVPSNEIGSWTAFVFSGMQFGVLVSPFLAGIVYQRVGYLAVFAMIFGVIGLDVVLRFFMIEKKEAYIRWAQDHRYVADDNVSEEESDSDYASSSEESTDLECESEEDPTEPTMGPDESSPLLARSVKAHGSKLGRAFHKTAVLISSRRLMAAIYGSFTHIFILTSFDAILPQFVKRTFGWGSASAGALFLAISGPCIFGPLFGSFSDRYGPRLVCLTGFAITTPAFVLLGLVKDDNIVDQVVLCLFLLLTGVGLTLVLAPLAADMFYEVEFLAESHPEAFGNAGAYAQAYSLLCSTVGLGTALGPILAGTLFEKTSWQTTQNALGVVCLLSSVGAYLYTGHVG